jgi:SAM-dependent methyltransferase
LETGRLEGDCLDYGCGKGYDADSLGIPGYDPNHRPELQPGQYDTIICNYVLNVIESPGKRFDTVMHIMSLLRPGGTAYISVRNDSFVEGYTSRGTWQGKVSVPFGTLHKKCSGYRMYLVKFDGEEKSCN